MPTSTCTVCQAEFVLSSNGISKKTCSPECSRLRTNKRSRMYAEKTRDPVHDEWQKIFKEAKKTFLIDSLSEDEKAKFSHIEDEIKRNHAMLEYYLDSRISKLK